MFVASGFLFGCWTMRALGSTFLLSALGVGFSPTLALVVMCLAAAASILPITAGGAIVSIGATSGVLLGLGVPKDAAVNFSLASGMLLTGTALVAAVVGVGGSLLYTLQRRRFARATSPSSLLHAQARALAVLGATLDLPGTQTLARLSKAAGVDRRDVRRHAEHDRPARRARRRGRRSSS